jgi:hypothetical protein
MQAERHVVTLTTAADGSATGYTPVVSGRVLGVRYVKTDFANGVDFTITAEATGESILSLTDQNASGSFYPRVPTCSTAGAAALYAAAGAAVNDHVCVANDRVKVVVAQGGDTKTGAVHVIIG